MLHAGADAGSEYRVDHFDSTMQAPERIHKAFKTELNPTDEQAGQFRRWAGCARYIYNWALSERIKAYEDRGETLTHYGQDKALTQLKRDPELEWLSEPSRRVLWYALGSLDEAYKHFFRRIKQGGEKAGFPRFKSKYRSTAAFTVRGSDIAVESKRIKLPKIGWVRLKERDYIPTDGARYMECTVSERAGRWFVSVSVECDNPFAAREPSGPVVAVHPGVRQFLTSGDAGTESREDNVRAFDRLSGRLAHYQREVEKARKRLRRQCAGSGRYERTERRIRVLRQHVARIHAQIADIRKDATHKATTSVTRSASKLILQDWGVKEMLSDSEVGATGSVRKRIHRAIADANMGEQIRQVKYKAEWRGVEITEVAREAPVSKRCSACGSVDDAFGAEPVFACPTCGVITDRETNAIVNLHHFATEEAA